MKKLMIAAALVGFAATPAAAQYAPWFAPYSYSDVYVQPYGGTFTQPYAFNNRVGPLYDPDPRINQELLRNWDRYMFHNY